MPPARPDSITRLVQQCDPNEELRPSDPRFVVFDDARGGSPIAPMLRSLRRTKKPERLLFAGHMGIGKSSELRRMQAELEQPTIAVKSFLVVWIDTTKQLDPNDLDFPDLLVLVAAEVQKQLKDAQVAGFTAPSVAMKLLWDDLRGLLGKSIHLKPDIEVDVGFASLALELRNRPDARKQLREEIEKLATNMLEAVNQLLDEANATLTKDGKAGLVLIIDGLEKISRRPLPDGGNTHDRLFIQRSAQLAGLRAHTIYTVPISLYYSPQCAVLEQAFGEFNRPVPMVRIRGEHRSPVTPDTCGMQKLWEMLNLRCKAADVPFTEAFPDDLAWQRLCEMSGGHPRHLLMLLHTAANQLDSLPITLAAVDEAVRTYANSLLREIPDAFWDQLRPFASPQNDISRDDDHQRMLYFLHVFEYLNGQPWFEVNPVLRTLERFSRD